MAKLRKFSEKYLEEYEKEEEKVSVNRLKRREEEGPVSVNRALEEEAEEKRESADRGKIAPLSRGERDPKLDEEPINEEDLNLPDGSYLLDRKVSEEDLLVHMDAQEKQFLGTNVRKIRDFVAIFDKGLSSPEDPKLDLSYEIDHNFEFKKQLVAQQLLRNYHSDDGEEVRNTHFIYKELKLTEEDSTFIDDLEDEDEQAYLNEELQNEIIKRLPKF